MPFVKLDCGMVDSSIWVDRDQRSIFITALLMAVPVELTEPAPQLQVRNLDPTGWMVPPGRYGFVEAAGTGIVRRDGMVDLEAGLRILEELGAPDPDSRSQDFDGRRLVRVDGGYVVLNYFLYRDRDYTAADRQRRHRERKKGTTGSVTRVTRNAVTRNVTQADAEADGEAKNLAVAVAETQPEVLPISPDLSTAWPEDAPLRLTRMLNCGLHDNPAIGDTYNPIIATSGVSLEASERLRDARVPIEFAEGWIYSLACAYKPRKLGDQINSVAYLVPAVLQQFEQATHKIDAMRAERPPEPRSPDLPPSGNPPPKPSQNGTRDLKGTAMLIFGKLRAGIAEQIIANDPNDPGAGNRMERRIRPDVMAELDAPAITALTAIGGERVITSVATEKVDSLSWRFAAAYQAAANG